MEEKMAIPEPASPSFVEEAHRQAAAVAACAHETDDQAFIDAISINGAS
jgi:hypothetical protein